MYILSRFNRLVPRTDIYQSQNRRFPYDPSPKNLMIPRRLTTIVIKDETTFTETYKKGEHVSAVLDFLCVGVCRWWSRDLQSVCLSFTKQLQVALKTERVSLLTRDMWWRCRVERNTFGFPTTVLSLLSKSCRTLLM
jgi:hypothetical protein